MDQTATGLMIANNALLLNGGLAEAALSQSPARSPLSHGPAALQLPGNSTGTSGLRSERVMSLLLALEALRAAPELLDTPKD